MTKMVTIAEDFAILDRQLGALGSETEVLRQTLRLVHARMMTANEVLLDALAFLVGIIKANDGHMWHEWQTVIRRVEGILSEAGKIPAAPPLSGLLP